MNVQNMPAIKIPKTKEYYEVRLRYIKNSFLKGNDKDGFYLTYGRKKIENLIDEYEKLNNPDKILAGTIKNFILEFINN